MLQYSCPGTNYRDLGVRSWCWTALFHSRSYINHILIGVTNLFPNVFFFSQTHIACFSKPLICRRLSSYISIPGCFRPTPAQGLALSILDTTIFKAVRNGPTGHSVIVLGEDLQCIIWGPYALWWWSSRVAGS